MKAIHLLLAEGHATIRDTLKQLLSATDDVLVGGEAVDAEEVLAKVRQRHWDVLLLGWSMARPNGLDLIRQIKNAKPELPILMLGTHSEAAYTLRALQAGASGYLPKDCNSNLLIAGIREVAIGGVCVGGEGA